MVDGRELILIRAEFFYNNKNYERSSTYYQNFFCKKFITANPESYESITNYLKDLYYYIITFTNTLIQSNQICRYDIFDLEMINKCLQHAENNLQKNNDTNDDEKVSYLRKSKEKFNEVHNFIFNITEGNTKFTGSKKIHSTCRPPGYPKHFVFDDHVFVFVNKRDNDCRYVCKFGANRHKGKNQCSASIALPFPLPDEDLDKIPVTILNNNHICSGVKNIVTKLINDAQIKAWVEETYYSITPRPTKTTTVSLVLKRIQQETMATEELQTSSELIINRFYTELENKNKVVDEDFRRMLKTARNTIFERFKLRYGEDELMVCYCSDFQKQCITESQFLFIDGTFDTAPKQFEQLLVIMGQTTHMNVPLCYMLLPNKKQNTYVTAFTLFMQEVQACFWNGATFITDFEKAEFNAVKKVLMNCSHRLHLCYFHFMQSMIRHFNSYPEDEVTDCLLQISKMLPFISEEMLNDAFDVMKSYPEMTHFVDYFTNTYLKSYNFEDWSVYNKPSHVVITNNVVESHNNLLKRRLGNQPSLQQFEVTISEIEDDFKRKYNQRVYEPPQVHRYNEDAFRRKLKELIDIIRSRRPIPQKRNEFANLYNQEDQYFTENNQEDDIPLVSDSDEDQTPNTNMSDEDIEDQELQEDDLEPQPRNANNPKTKQFKMKQKADIRKLPIEARQVLISQTSKYENLPKRSDLRKKVIEETLEIVQGMQSNITYEQVRSFFCNNITKK